MGEIGPSLSVVVGTVDAGQVFLIFVVPGAAFAEIVVCCEQRSIGEPDDARTTKVGFVFAS